MSSEEEGEQQQQRQKDINFPTTGYEAPMEERQSIEQEQDEEQSQNQQPATHNERGRKEGRRARLRSTGIAAAAGRQMTLFDLDRQLGSRGGLWKEWQMMSGS